jgi:hypothetical protein
LRHFASRRFWQRFEQLPESVQGTARRKYELLKNNPTHPSLHFKDVAGGRYRSVRVGLHYRALGVPVSEGTLWFWIGTHAEYDKLIS